MVERTFFTRVALNRRWWIACCLAAAILLISACTPEPDEAPAPKFHTLDTHLTERYTGDLPTLMERKYIRVLTTTNRNNFYLFNGKPRGLEYALLKAYQQELNENISNRALQIVFEFIPVSRDRLIPGLVEGTGDIAAASLTITPRRKKMVDFTEPYLSGVNELLVSHRDIAPLDNREALSGEKVFVRRSSSYYESLQSLNRQLRSAGKRPVRIIPVDEDLETEDILQLVNAGAIPRTLCDSHIVRAWAPVLGDIRIHENIILRKGSAIAWAVRKTSPLLKASLNDFIHSHRQGTRLGNIFFRRYYENTALLKRSLGSTANRQLATYAPLFKKFATRYGFDWRLIGAMANQESGLDHSRVSSRGAVGIMQIRPQTAADPNVGIPDVSSLENNIHAAVKYLNFLRRHYFSDPAIRDRDKVRFSLAAYNAGPAKVHRARSLAEKMNLNPNRWFRNVEIAMLKLVGQETVQYVSNINKYYVVYQKVAEQLEKRQAAMAQEAN